MADIPLRIISEYASTERIVNLSWTISQLKLKLQPVTGIPPSHQQIFYKMSSGKKIAVESPDDESFRLRPFLLEPYDELLVVDTRPVSEKPNFLSEAGVDRYVLPEEEYKKKDQKLGYFDPNDPSYEQAKIDDIAQEVEARGIAVGKRCRVDEDDARRGEIKYVGEVKEIPGLGAWVGVQLDEPVDKNEIMKNYQTQESQIGQGLGGSEVGPFANNR
ncbi:hypothetical protein C8A00DRAFT_45753 [Chaetomidium leptoderma]|uniref:Ubiquitin-like domain-containing protein n=1 Tax=Chaetomidium leptoderma TaxID=669021 RepID=A0AAN6VIU0_9PEZI|nr:hypothetical protein C8A00DRAFT_45753 [Chaetomidium leptoderma]